MPDGFHRIGEAAALATAVCWAFTALLFAAASRRAGAGPVNLLRLVLATVLLFASLLVAGPSWSLPGPQLLFLSLSGVVGLTLGDAAYFRCLQVLGPRRAALTMAFAPALTAVLMVPLLGETIGAVGIAGMFLTLGGILWVHAERDDGGEILGNAREGLLMGFLGSLGQAGGVVLAKVGLGMAPAGGLLPSLAGLGSRLAEGTPVAGEEVSPLYGTFLRMAAGTAAMLALAAAGLVPGGFATLFRDRKALGLTVAGSFTGPFVGVWLSLVAVFHTNTAVAATIMAASPVFVIPLVRIVHRQRVSWRAWLGALVALLGVAMLSFRHEIRG